MDEIFLLNKKDVVSLMEGHATPILYSQTFKVSQFAQAVVINAKLPKEWAESGMACEVLRIDKLGWQKGRVRISLEFTPDEPESDEPEVDEPDEQPKASTNEVNDMQVLRAKLDL